MPRINPDNRNKGFDAAQEASADYLLEQKGSQKAKESQAKAKTTATSATREDERIAQSVGAVIQKWDTALRDALEELYAVGAEIGELVSGMRAVMHMFKIFKEADSDGKFRDVVLQGSDALDFLEAMEFLGFADEVTVQNCTIVFTNGPATSVLNIHANNSVSTIVSKIEEYESQGWQIQTIDITIYGPSDSNQNVGTTSLEIYDLIKENIRDTYDYVSNEIAQLKPEQTKIFFKVMAALSFKRSNISVLTNIIEALKTINSKILNQIS